MPIKRTSSRISAETSADPSLNAVWSAGKLRGVNLNSTGLASGMAYVYDGTEFVPEAVLLLDGTAAMTGDLSLGGNDLTNVLTATGTGDLDFGGGYRQSYDGWYADNVGTGSGPTQMSRFANGADVDKLFVGRSGSITGVWVHSGEARTAGTLTVEVYKNGAGTGLTAVLDGTNTTFKATTQAKDLDTLAAGDYLDIRFTTDGSWAPGTADIRAGLEIET